MAATTIQGVVTRKLWQDEESGRALLVVGYENGGVIEEARMWVANSTLEAGDAFAADGEWKSRTHRGRVEEQFEAYRSRPEMPTTKRLTERFLRVNFGELGYTGEAVTRLLATLGEDATRVLVDRPQLLLDGAPRDADMRAILALWRKRTASVAAVDLMAQAGLERDISDRVMTAWGGEAIRHINENPYRAARLPRVGFSNADLLGLSLGISVTDGRRLNEMLLETLAKLRTEGSTAADIDTLTARLGGWRGINGDVLRTYLKALKPDDFRVLSMGENMVVAHGDLLGYEVQISQRVLGMLRTGRRRKPADVAQLMASVMRKPEFARFDRVQQTAVMMAVCEPVSIVTGGPGVGKSTVMEAAAEAIERVRDGELFLAAPFGKAAKRLAQASGRRATTLHRLLGARMKGDRTTFKHNADNRLPAGCTVIVDEVSTQDTELFHALMMAMPDDGRVVLVGDPEQLRSVGPGAVLGDLLRTGLVPSVALTEVYRSGRDSGIAIGAGQMRDGIVPELTAEDRAGVSFVEVVESDIVDRVEELVCRTLPAQGYDPVRDVAVLCPQAPGPAGTWALNTRLSRRLNPRGADIPGVFKTDDDESALPVPRVGDRVMLTKNMRVPGSDAKGKSVAPADDDYLMNADLGTVTRSCSTDQGKAAFAVRFDDDPAREHIFPATQWRLFILAFAGTIHKYQGSQAKVVVMPIAPSHEKMLDRSMVYTGWTRARERLVAIGSRSAFETGVRTSRMGERVTLLTRLLTTLARQQQAIVPAADWPALTRAAREAVARNRATEKPAVSAPVRTAASAPSTAAPAPAAASRPVTAKTAGLSRGFGFGAARVQPTAVASPSPVTTTPPAPARPGFGQRRPVPQAEADAGEATTGPAMRF